jgi:hypothetical protein
MPYLRTMIDYDRESTTFRVKTTPLTATNFDAQVALNVALGAAIAGITRGHQVKISYGNEITTVQTPDDPLSQRENKWLIRFHDATTDAVQTPIELGTADLTLLDPNNRGFAEMGDSGPVDAFVDAFEAYVLSAAGNAVVVDSIEFVGRNT